MYRKLCWLVFIVLIPSVAFATDRLQPSDLNYQGAMRMPTGTRNGGNWYDDPHESSGLGWDSASNCILIQGRSTVDQFTLTECLVPATPVASATKNLADLPAMTVAAGKSFADITINEPVGTYRVSDAEYFPQQAGQDSDKYYFTRFDYYEVMDLYTDLIGWSNTDFSNPSAQGLWNLGTVASRKYNKYMTKIDDTWATSVLGYSALGVGRSRTDGSFGPSLYAIRPWNDNAGSPPTAGTALASKTLILYDVNHTVESFSYSTTTKDAVWLKNGTKQAFVVYEDNGYREESNCDACAYNGSSRFWHSSGDGRSSAYKNTDTSASTLSSSIDTTQTTIPVASSADFSPSGRVRINKHEYVGYTGISGNTLTGCTRGVSGGEILSATAGMVVEQVMPDVMDYGDDNGGYNSCFVVPMLLFYDVDQIAEIANGTRQSYDIQPYAYMSLDKFFYHSPANTKSKASGSFTHGITTDGTNVWIGEYNGDPGTYTKTPLIHAFDFSGGGGADTTAPTAPASVSVNSSGVVTWDQVNDAAVYVVFKWFGNAYKTISEYRPIRTALDTTWTDPLYQAGDKYQIVAHDKNMNASTGTSTEGGSPPSGGNKWRVGKVIVE